MALIELPTPGPGQIVIAVTDGKYWHAMTIDRHFLEDTDPSVLAEVVRRLDEANKNEVP